MQVSNVRAEIITEMLIPKELMELRNPQINIFALDTHTIGLSNTPPEFWADQCLWKSVAQVNLEDNGESTILLPQQIVSFYQPRKIELSVDVKKTRILLVINPEN